GMGAAIPADLSDFIARITARGTFGGSAELKFGPAYAARAPGRLDVMGGIADYSGALVLQWPIRESTRVALTRHPDRVLDISSVSAGRVRRVDVPLDV